MQIDVAITAKLPREEAACQQVVDDIVAAGPFSAQAFALDVADGGAFAVAGSDGGDSDRTPPRMRGGRAAYEN